jgi:hypothetical protein
MIRRAFWAKGAALLLAGGLATSTGGCSGGTDNQAAEAPGDTQAVRANMVYYAMPG